MDINIGDNVMVTKLDETDKRCTTLKVGMIGEVVDLIYGVLAVDFGTLCTCMGNIAYLGKNQLEVVAQ